MLCCVTEHRGIHSEVCLTATTENSIPHRPPAAAITIYRTLAGPRRSEESSSLPFPLPLEHMTEKELIQRAETPVKQIFREVGVDACSSTLSMRRQHSLALT